MLGALVRHDYVQREEPGGTYTLGPAALALSAAAQFRLQRIAHAELRKLTDETAETSLLHVRSGLQTLCIDKVESPRPVRVTYDIGLRGPLHAGSSGKTLLAFFEPGEREEVLSKLDLERYTSSTITDSAELREDLAQIRQQGYSQTIGELDEDVYAVGVPIWNHLGRLEGGVTLVGPAARWTKDSSPSLIEATLAAARRISHQLGHTRQGGSRTPPTELKGRR
jgi:DNA-binding IclR family transcriptional regulator